jgi:hypothetical protein
MYLAFFKPVVFSSLLIFILITGCKSKKPEIKDQKVFVRKEKNGYVLIRNGSPFMIKGAAGQTNLAKLNEIGGNTIRTYDTLNIGSVLDSAEANHIAVIVSLPMASSNDFQYFYNDTSKIAFQYKAFKSIVEKYKDHPALLMWCLGNELEFPYKPSYNDFYKTLNNLLEMIHSVDPNHPVTTTLMSLQTKYIINLQVKMPDLDIISINTFGRLSSIRQDLKDLDWIWDGPFIISEWGTYGYWEEDSTAWGVPIENTSTKKAEQYQKTYNSYMPVEDPRFLGSCVFYWGQKQETTHTWFSMFTENGVATESVGTMQYLWTGKAPANGAPQIKYMLVENKGARDNIFLKPNTTHSAEVFMVEGDKDPLTVKWEILPEDWYNKNETKKKPLPLKELIISSEGMKVTFRTPSNEGPYRLFFEVFDNHGYVATTNTPFYVIK